MSPCHLPPSSLLGAAPGRQLAQSGVSCPQFQQLGRAQRWLQPNPSHAQLGAIPCLPLLGFPLLCQVGLAASTAGVLPAPACPHQQRFPAAEPCRLPLDEGDCQRYTLRWYYNQRVTECRPFVYSGCRGNLNRFGSKEECELHCGQRPGAGRQSWAQLGTGRSSSIPTPCRGLSNAELGGQCWSPTSALTVPCFSPQIPVAVPAARWEGSQRCRCRQCLGRQGCLEVGPGCCPGRGWAAHGGGGHAPTSPSRNLVLFLTCLYAAHGFFISYQFIVIKVKFISNGKLPPTKALNPLSHMEVS